MLNSKEGFMGVEMQWIIGGGNNHEYSVLVWQLRIDGYEKGRNTRWLAVEIHFFFKERVRKIPCRKLRKRAYKFTSLPGTKTASGGSWISVRASIISFSSDWTRYSPRCCLILTSRKFNLVQPYVTCSLLIKLPQFISPLGIPLIIMRS